MGKFDTKTRGRIAPVRQASPVVSRRTPGSTATTYNGAPDFERNAKGELFLLSVTNMVSEDTFYESASARDSRFSGLVQTVTREDPAWVARLLRWLRAEANMRSASVAGAVEYVLAGGPNGASVVDSVCLRADEPAEVLAYASLVTGKGPRLPQPIKRGVAKAAQRLFNERNALKYDGNSRNWRMADVLQVAHVRPTAPWQNALFKWLLDSRYGNVSEISDELQAVIARGRLQSLNADERHAFTRQVQLGSTAAAREFELAMATQWEWAKSWLGTS